MPAPVKGNADPMGRGVHQFNGGCDCIGCKLRRREELAIFETMTQKTTKYHVTVEVETYSLAESAADAVRDELPSTATVIDVSEVDE
jgi:hypothetical protein